MKIAVIGLGYVGLPLAEALAKQFDLVGIDIDERRIAGLRGGDDRTGEIDRTALAQTSLQLESDFEPARAADLFIVTVPTRSILPTGPTSARSRRRRAPWQGSS